MRPEELSLSAFTGIKMLFPDAYSGQPVRAYRAFYLMEDMVKDKMNNEEILSQIKYDNRGLVPAIVQDAKTNQVLMLAYMNAEALKLTLTTGRTWFYSRSRQSLWNKGETSGHFQNVKKVSYDCDCDTILVIADQIGAACHTGNFTCFYRNFELEGSDNQEDR